MAKLTQEIKDVFAKSRPFIMATADKDGKPNGVPIGLAKIISDDEIMLVDLFMHKSVLNIKENPWVSITFWNTEVRYGYQVKGKAILETSGKYFDEAEAWLEGRQTPFDAKPKTVVVVKVEEIYYIGAGKDSSIRLDQQDAG
jgi:predicted pyridoxine 5'-phosphate oxidase superfamily flavin-nucleotide-binding protein